MVYYSEILHKTFKDAESCLAAEKEYNEKIAAEKAAKEAMAEKRKERAKEVEDAYKKVEEAQKAYYELRDKFIEDYGSFHMTISKSSSHLGDIFDLFRFF